MYVYMTEHLDECLTGAYAAEVTGAGTCKCHCLSAAHLTEQIAQSLCNRSSIIHSPTVFSPCSLASRYLVQHRMVDVIVTTAGGVEEDLIKCMGSTYIGDFAHKGEDWGGGGARE